jgi:hypothetical protein
MTSPKPFFSNLPLGMTDEGVTPIHMTRLGSMLSNRRSTGGTQ